MDLMTRAAADTAEYTVLDPIADEADTPILDANGQPWKVTFAGPAHPVTLKLRNEAVRKNLKAMRTKAADLPTAEENERENAEFIAARIVDWGPILVGGETFAATEANKVKLLADPKFGWLTRQFNVFLMSEQGFIAASAKT